MLLAQARAFLAVARIGNVSRAAEELYLTQPALTARLKALEADLGEVLFDRSSRGMTLTDAGRAFLPYAQRALNALEDGRGRLDELRRGVGEQLRIAATPGVSAYALPSMLERFTASYPAVTVSVRTGHSEDVVELVVREEVHVGIGRAIRRPDIRSVTLYEDEIVLVVERHHWLTASPMASLRDIAEDRLILFDQSSSYYELTRTLFRTAGIIPTRTMELDNIEAAKRMVERGLGVALLPRQAVIRDVAEGRLYLIPLETETPVRRPIVAHRRRDAAEIAVVINFLRIARQSVGVRS
jgi:DNA-binding transcriptional LysR family regulator